VRSLLAKLGIPRDDGSHARVLAVLAHQRAERAGLGARGPS
jgi:hypothetical protein